MKNQNGNAKIKIVILLAILFIAFIVPAGADGIIYRYQKMLVEKINNSDIKDIEFENAAWEEAKKIAVKYIGSAEVEKPLTLMIKNSRYLDSSKGLRGLYDTDLNIVIATDRKVLVHEYLHAIFYLTGNRKIAEDESFIRELYPPF